MQIWSEEYLSQIRWLIELWLRSVKKEIYFLKKNKSKNVSNIDTTTYFLNIFLNIVKITIIKIITDIIMIGRAITKYDTPNLKKFLKNDEISSVVLLIWFKSIFFKVKWVLWLQICVLWQVIFVRHYSILLLFIMIFMTFHKTKWITGIYL